MPNSWRFLTLIGLACLVQGCTRETIDFVCDAPGRAVLLVDRHAYEMPTTVTFKRRRKDIRLDLPRAGGQSLHARGEITFDRSYEPTDVDRFARLRVIISQDLIESAQQGNAVEILGRSASDQMVFRLLFGKE